MLMLNTGEKSYPDAPAIIPGGEWINTKPLTLKDLRGKVVLVDFWTYTCINCIRTLPYLKDWHEKYAEKGLVIIGVHTPEFEFEKNAENVRKAVKDFGLLYPVVQDNDYATWQAYDNHYWPAKYFIDKNGKVRSSHFGEGEYAESEKLIQKLLKEAGEDVSNTPVNNKTYSVSADTPETYLGYGRMEHFVSPEQILRDKKGVYSVPVYHPESSFAYSGNWTIGKERAVADRKAELVFHYNAKDVYLVMRSTDKTPTTVRVLVDDQPISPTRSGKDVKNGVVTVTADRLYHLVSTTGSEDHFVTLQFPDGRVEVYAFTFG
jgi:thiol-disulfide isomerase/thioredoxin